jgi:hypothetical protein
MLLERTRCLRVGRGLAATVAVGVFAGLPTAGSAASTAPARACFAEVRYTDQAYGHTYEYRCGPLRLHAGQIVVVPVRSGSLTTARIIWISQVRTYFGGPLKTVRSVY